MTERLTPLLLVLALGIAAAVGASAGNYYLTVALAALLFGSFAAAADLSIGVAGLLSLGSAIYFGIGAYAVALAQRYGLGFAVGVMMGAGVASVIAAALGYVGLTARRATIQFALLTLIASLTCEQVIVNYDVLGRSNGLPGLRLPVVFGSELSLRSYYFVCVVGIFAVLGCLHGFLRSRAGRLLILTRDEPEKAEALGHDVKRIKIGAAVASAALSAASGAAYVGVIGIAFPGMFSVLPNMLVLVWIALGGPGTLLGPFFAAIAIKLIEFRLGSAYTDTYVLVVGVVFVLAVSFAPNGLWGLRIPRSGGK